ncbi:hypothetical protein LJR255_005266 [Pararhizobium sp. LjRoot255]|uniref:hypothetical protein n=1 Tax=Pararhizobium sp. LjRoot255 TaxID=3342298 RepID=UPI003ECF459A
MLVEPPEKSIECIAVAVLARAKSRYETMLAVIQKNAERGGEPGDRGRIAPRYTFPVAGFFRKAASVKIASYWTKSPVAVLKNTQPSTTNAPMATLCTRFMRRVRFPSQS